MQTAVRRVRSTICDEGAGPSNRRLLKMCVDISGAQCIRPLEDLLNETLLVSSRLVESGSLGAQYFQASVELQHTMYTSLWRANIATAHAILAFSADTTWSFPAIKTNISVALDEFERIFRSQRHAEAVRWRGLYAADKITDIHRSRRIVRRLGVALENFWASPSYKRTVPPEPGVGAYQFYDYQIRYQRNFPLLHESSQWNLYKLVRIYCASSLGGCRNTADGGSFSGTGAVVTMNAIEQGCPIYYTTNGQQPTRDSWKFVSGQQPIPLNGTTRFKAALLCAHGNGSRIGFKDPLISSVTFWYSYEYVFSI